jgi:hypothetical protein
MSELEQLTQIIDTILAHDNKNRKEGEAILKNIRDRDFNAYITAFTSLLKATDKSPVKVFCLVHLRRLCSDFVESTDSKWPLVHPDTQKFMKDLLLDMLQNDKDTAARKVLCDFIGDLAATIQCLSDERKKGCTEEAYTWPSLMPFLWGLLTSSDAGLVENSLRIMGVLFVHCGRLYASYKDELAPVLKQTMTHPVASVNVAAMEALTCYLENVEFKNCKAFIELMPTMLQQTLSVANQNEDLGVDAVAAIADILDTEPKMLRGYYKELIELFRTILKSQAEDALKQTSLETLVLAVERMCKLFNNDQGAVKEIAELIFTYMVATDEDPEDEWLSPPEGYVEDVEGESQDSNTWFCMGLIDRMIRALNKKKTLPLFSNLILEMVRQNNWRYQHAALMSLFQVGEFLDDMAEFEPIIEFVVNFFQSEHPKVRFAALHVVGQTAEDCRPYFQAKFGKGLIEKVLPLCNDPIPRVVAHALNCLTNYLEECPKDAAMETANEVLNACLHWLEHGGSFIKESCCTAIGSLAETLEADFAPLWPKTAEAIFITLESADKKLKTLRANLVEALTIVGAAVGKQEFRKVAHKVIEKMLEIQNNDLDKLDPQTAFLLSSWHRVASTLEEEFAQYLHQVMPSLFSLVDGIIKAEEDRAKEILDDEEDNQMVARAITGDRASEQEKETKSLFHHVNTSESDEISVAAKMMRGFAIELKGGYFAYVEQTSEVLVHLLINSENEDVRKEAALGLPEMIKVIQASNHPNKLSITRNLHNLFMKNLWEAVWSELDAEIMKHFVEVMQDVLVAGDRCMSEDELNEVNECVLKTLKISDERKNENTELYNENNDDEYDDEDAEMLDATNKLEDELHLALAELIGTLFKVYKELTIPLAKLIYREILPKVLNADLPMNLQKFGLFLIDDMIEHLGIELIPEEWPELSQALLKYATDEHIHLRHAAIYGIGWLGEKSKETFKQMSGDCMQVLYKGLEIRKKNDEDVDEFISAKDNIVAAFGKIIKSQHENINLPEAISVWVNNLPLRVDHEEGKVQHELLVDIILESDAALIFGQNGENLPRTVKVLAEVLDTKGASKEFKGKARKVIDLLAGTETTKVMLQDAVAKLEPKLQNKIKALVQ